MKMHYYFLLNIKYGASQLYLGAQVQLWGPGGGAAEGMGAQSEAPGGGASEMPGGASNSLAPALWPIVEILSLAHSEVNLQHKSGAMRSSKTIWGAQRLILTNKNAPTPSNHFIHLWLFP